MKLTHISRGLSLLTGSLLAFAAVQGSPVQAAPAPANSNTIQIKGKVLDATGNPLAGATVECYQMPGATAVDKLDLSKTVTTSSDGAFDFSVPVLANFPTFLLARKTGLAPAWAQFWNPKELPEQQLVLTAPTTLAGTIADEAGKPLADVEVWVAIAYTTKEMEGGGTSYAYISGKPAKSLFSARSGADGKFRLEGVPTNMVADLGAIVTGKVLRQPKRRYISPENMACRSGQQDVQLVMERAGSIEGKVVKQDGAEPVADATVFLEAGQPEEGTGTRRDPVQTDAQGLFKFTEVAPASYRLLATFGTNEPPAYVAESVPASVEAGDVPTKVTLAAVTGGFLEVTAVGKENQQPVAGASVEAARQNSRGFGGTSSNGVALLRLVPGNYQVNVTRENVRPETQTATIEAGETNRLKFELPNPPRLAGTVTDPSGKPVPGMNITVFPSWGRMGGKTVKTDDQGRYEMPWNQQQNGPNEKFSLVVRDETRNLAAAADIEEGLTQIDLRLEPGLTVVGQVQDAEGKPLPKATVRLFLWSGNSGSQFNEAGTKVDPEGKFAISSLPAGRRYSLDATAKGYGSANRQISVEETNRVELEPLVLNVADRVLAGQVFDNEDKPVSGASIYMYGQGQPNGSVRTDDKGWFHFEAVCEGSVQVSANYRDSYGNARAQGGDTNVVIKLGQTSSYRPVVVRPSLKGKPLPELAGLGLAAEAVPAGKPVLLCLFDVDQRPSRRAVRLLGEQHDALRAKGLTVLAIQASVSADAAFQEWKTSSPVPFAVGAIKEKSPQTKWVTDIQSFPWLIVTDADHRVTAEGFALEDLEANLPAGSQ